MIHSGKSRIFDYDRPDWFDRRLREIDMFFAGNDRVHQTMHRVADVLEKANIAYAIVGGMAVNAHGHQRTTGDANFLLTSEGFAAFRLLLDSSDFQAVPGRPRRFFDRTTDITFDVLVTGMCPGSGKPGPIAYPAPPDVAERIDDRSYVSLHTLIELKLAAGRYQDFGDVVNLIAANDLDESVQAKIHPSVQHDYIECLEEKRREDEYEARQDAEFKARFPDEDADSGSVQ